MVGFSLRKSYIEFRSTGQPVARKPRGYRALLSCKDEFFEPVVGSLHRVLLGALKDSMLPYTLPDVQNTSSRCRKS